MDLLLKNKKKTDNFEALNCILNLLQKAIEASVNETERRMLLDKAKLTDYQATDQALLAQVAR